jgi:CRISPR-associated endonuclease/helicase Cas3
MTEHIGVWAKLQRDDDTITSWHSLPAHCADVAACFEALLGETILNRRLGRLAGLRRLERPHIHRLSVLAAIHDAGKVNNGFQARKRRKSPPIGHVKPMVDVLLSNGSRKPEIIGALHAADMVGWFAGGEEQLVPMLLASWGHHGQPVVPGHDFQASLWRTEGDYDPVEELARLVELAFEWFPEAVLPASAIDASPAFQHAFNGVLTLADWLGSDADRFFPFAPSDAQFIDRARAGANRAIQAFGLSPTQAREALGEEAPGFEAVSEFDPFPAQAEVVESPTLAGGSLMVLESDTGSGKTEAAIARFVRLFHAGEVDGLYFALPTRAAATQIYSRVQAAVSRAFGDSAPPVVLALPGYMSVDGKEGQRLAPFEVLWPDDQLNERGWAAEGPKRFLASPIAVGTIDQALLSTLKVRHAHMRASALLRHLLIVDEVHASDPYMASLLDHVLEHHLDAGGHAFLMSATLGVSTRFQLFGRSNDSPDHESARHDPYPLLSYSSGRGAQQTNRGLEHSGYEKSVRLELAPMAGEPEAIVERALAAARQGARVLIIRNLVRDCVETQQALEDAEPNTGLMVKGLRCPHHSRFAGPDRKLLDRAVESDFGKGSQRKGVITVATQTVEQSLDIDADILITDLCPVDVLLQRIGRLHRHSKRTRPNGFETAVTIVITPDERDLATSIDAREGEGKGKHGIGRVYADLRIIEATWRLIEDEPQWEIPEMNRFLVEQATHPGRLNQLVLELGGPWERHQNFITAIRFADRATARRNVINRKAPFAADGEGFPASIDERIATRLGESDRLVEFSEPVDTPFGNSIRSISVPAWMAREFPADIEPVEPRSTRHGFEFQVANVHFTYDRFGLAKMES